MTTHLKRSSILKRYYINIINDATTTQPNILRAVVARRSFVNNDIPPQSQRYHKRYASFTTSSIYNGLETRIHINHPNKKQPLIFKRNLSSLSSSSSSSTLSPAIIRKVQSMSNRHAEILSTLQSDEASSNDATALGKELSSLANVASLLDKLTSLEEEFKSIQELSEEAVNDEELQQECREEMDGLNEKKNLLEQCLIEAVIPKDEDDYGCDAILEIRAGTGGDETRTWNACNMCH
uniref:Peptide chain release factor domain-containing protein n=1 Tax=Ditylum brightwellii TaxID=49249 RepID=A0A7S4V7C3_9STRA